MSRLCVQAQTHKTSNFIVQEKKLSSVTGNYLFMWFPASIVTNIFYGWVYGFYHGSSGDRIILYNDKNRGKTAEV